MIAASLLARIVAFRTAVTVAQPLARAPRAQLADAVGQGIGCLAALDAAIAETAPGLDSPQIRVETPSLIADDIRAVGETADDAVTLSDLRGYLGRAVLNLAQA